MTSTCISASGKVLVAGGYLVLDPAYSGIVVSTSSRFYTYVTAGNDANEIRVRSPQFKDATWNYTFGVHDNEVTVEAKVTNAAKNKFVHLALKNTLTLVAELKGITSLKQALSNGLDVVIVGDNDFYSQRAKLAELKLPRTVSSLTKIPPFSHTGVDLANVHKTGLGSSAALITSLVTALLVHFSAIASSDLDETVTDGRRLAHNLAQFVHCLAQGKVGSGFDVCAAAFGSQLYTRFNPAVLEPLMGGDAPKSLLPILSSDNIAWDYSVKPFQLPPFTRLMLADVDAGSDTPSLVGKVLKWRADNSSQAHSVWTGIDQANQSLASTLSSLSKLFSEDEEAYIAAVKFTASLQPIQWMAHPSLPEKVANAVATFHQAHIDAEAIREKMREMGQLAGVPIEPTEQTNLLDECTAVAGVIGGGVPGAGGYDAIWLLVCDPPTVPDLTPLQRVEHSWNEWKELDVSPLLASESSVKGIRIEKPEEIPGLLDATS